MSAAATQPDPTAHVQEAFERLRAGHRELGPPDYAARMAHLQRLRDVLVRRQHDIARAISSDFGHRSHHETVAGEIFVVLATIDHTRKHLKRWMKPESRPVSWVLRPGSASVVVQPLGVVGVIAPWNYPVQLAFAPLAQALAAGNRVLLKPSELTPATSALIAEIAADTFPRDLVDVVLGGADVGHAVASLPLDHLLFTGSTRIGRLIMKAAAENLVPVTLELGGKSPAIVHPDYPLEKAVDRIVAGKTFNAGQTCIAPDYVLLPEGKVEAFVDAVQKTFARMFPTLADNPDYSWIVADHHYERLHGLVRDAERHGARSIVINPKNEELPGRKFPLTLLTGVNDKMHVMKEEIFGPLLPVVTYRHLDEAIRYVEDHPRPLALYYFDHDGRRVQDVLRRTTSGGVTVNDTLFHEVAEDLPFGGVGPSGMGRYHGHEGFLTFSHSKGVFHQSRVNGAGLLSPPYGKAFERLMRFLVR